MMNKEQGISNDEGRENVQFSFGRRENVKGARFLAYCLLMKLNQRRVKFVLLKGE